MKNVFLSALSLSILFANVCAFSNDIIAVGSGQYEMTEKNGLNGKPIEIFYYRATNFNPNSPIVIVMPGGGRNGDDYRDAWITAAEKFGLLVLSPSFSEDSYPGPLSYNLGRIIAKADRETLEGMELRENPDAWIFNDIDQIFVMAKGLTESTRDQYEFFGHSAGGQIGHRLALFNTMNKANTILAANSGWYTAADFDIAFPFGLKGAPINQANLESIFQKKLVVFLGELDDANETRGHLRRGPQLDVQGEHRLARGTYFFNTAQKQAEEANLQYNWQLEIVPDVGHSYREMSQAAAQFLFAD